MSGRVPLARRNLLADRRRLGAGVVGVGLAVMLILLLDGMWAGIQAQATVYSQRSGADLFVLQPGVRDLTAGAGTLPTTTVDVALSDPDVAWAAPVRTACVILQLHARKVAAYLVGSVPGERGGPWSMVAGPRRSPTACCGWRTASSAQLAAMATDPVCEMAVETGVGPHLAVEDRTFWFCSAHCRDEFRGSPERFTQGGENAHSAARG